jgi:1,4-dihydroxy-6-naphthoate synthase
MAAPLPRTIRLSYSPDADDAFMFWAIAEGRVDTRGLRFSHERADTEALNRAAEGAPARPPAAAGAALLPDAEASAAPLPDVTAVSIHQYAYLARDWLLLPHGGSVGDGYGPVVVAARPMDAAALRGARVGVPGLRTTAYLALRLLVGDFEPVPIPISPFRRAFEAVRAGEVDAALLIHEGRLLYEREGLHRVLELGEAWRAATGHVLPLGGNVIRRALGADVIALVSAVLRDSIAHALAQRDEALDWLLAHERRDGVPRDRALFDRYLAMYANRDTLDYGERGRAAIADLLARGADAGLCPRVRLEFAP